VRFQKAFAKSRNGTALIRDDFVELITKSKLPTEAANGKNIRELALKWQDQKHWLDEFFEIIPR
jgi:hypothetical protein